MSPAPPAPSQPHRPEIQGLRAVASILVAIYHIWLGRVSGGVDVFFVVSGFLITRSLLGQVERDGSINALKFWGRLVQRLFPCALLVLLIVAVATVVWLPQFRWQASFSEILASTFYFENWQLASTAVDYLDRENAQSPVQHYWALAVQGQFYLLWPAVVFTAVWFSKRSGIDRVKALRWMFSALFIASLSYSIVRTQQDQAFTYFDTGARIWEFSIGALLAVTPAPKLGAAAQSAISWLGLLMIVLCGVLLRVSTEFPGYAALWPTLAVSLILMAGATPAGPFSATALLGSRSFAGFGDISYAFYLWHWPLLVFFQFFLGKNKVGTAYGMLILVLSAVLAYVTTYFIEAPARRTQWAKAKPFAFGGAWLAANVLVLGLWHVGITTMLAREGTSEMADYPGARVVRPGAKWHVAPKRPMRPSALTVKNDLPQMYTDGCHETMQGATPRSCTYGDLHAKTTLALVGGSHAAQWLPALEILAQEMHFKIVSFTRSACRFERLTNDTLCGEWVTNVYEELKKSKPDFLFTTATSGQHAKRESVSPHAIARWKDLESIGIQVIAIRDNPWFGFDSAECVERYGRDARKCSRLRRDVLADPSPLLRRDAVPDNVRLLDLSDYFCQGKRCPPIIGNVLVYRDRHHITTLYAASLAPALKQEMQRAHVQW